MASSPRIVSLFPLRRRRLACEADRRRLADELQSQEDDIGAVFRCGRARPKGDEWHANGAEIALHGLTANSSD